MNGVTSIWKTLNKQMNYTNFWLIIMLRMMVVISDLTIQSNSLHGHLRLQATRQNGLLVLEEAKTKSYMDLYQASPSLLEPMELQE